MKKTILITLSALSLGATAYAGNTGTHSKKAMNSDMQEDSANRMNDNTGSRINNRTATGKAPVGTKVSTEMDNAQRNSAKPYARNKSEIQVGNDSNAMPNKARNTMNMSRVKGVQTSLKNSGYNVSVDGYMGQQTTTALKKFQKDNNIEATGKLDSKTKTALMGNSKNSPNEDY